MQRDGSWISILEYVKHTGKSISTIRRLIKSNNVQSKKVDGKFYIWAYIEENKNNGLEYENKKLKNKILKQKEEIAELQMLVKLYEENNTHSYSSL